MKILHTHSALKKLIFVGKQNEGLSLYVMYITAEKYLYLTEENSANYN
jgi:hypothetical protein